MNKEEIINERRREIHSGRRNTAELKTWLRKLLQNTANHYARNIYLRVFQKKSCSVDLSDIENTFL